MYRDFCKWFFMYNSEKQIFEQIWSICDSGGSRISQGAGHLTQSSECQPIILANYFLQNCVNMIEKKLGLEQVRRPCSPLGSANV